MRFHEAGQKPAQSFRRAQRSFRQLVDSVDAFQSHLRRRETLRRLGRDAEALRSTMSSFTSTIFTDSSGFTNSPDPISMSTPALDKLRSLL
jgi:hypothetical protein